MVAHNTLYNSVIHRYVPEGRPACGRGCWGRFRRQAGAELEFCDMGDAPGLRFVRPGLIDRPTGLCSLAFTTSPVHILADRITAGITPVTLLRGDRV